MLPSDTSTCYKIATPDGQNVDIPSQMDPQTDVYLQLNSTEAKKKYYLEQGYVVVRNMVSADLCDQIAKAFQDEVKPFKGYIYRQTSSYPEKHAFSEGGYILNSIKHIQDMNAKQFPNFIQKSFQAIAHPDIAKMVKHLINDDSIIVQTMCFEGNPSTPAHVDSYYLDSADRGQMVAIWIALEDIHPGAGRFFVYPKSHRLNLPPNEGAYEITENHDNYLKAIRDLITSSGIQCHAPALKKGDVLFWNANTIHGSLATTEPQYSRLSLTAHFIPASKNYILLQKVQVELNIKKFHGHDIHCPKDQNKMINRLQMFGLQHFPTLTNNLRKCIIRFRMNKS